MCECGCGQEVTNEKNRFINRHCRRGKTHSKEARLKLSISHIGHKLSNETILKLSKPGRKNKGIKLSEDHKLKMSKAKRGKILSEQHKFNIANHHSYYWKGKKRSLESCLKMSDTHKKRIEENGMSCVNEGNNERYILDIISNKCNVELLRNNQNISKKIKGKSADGYSLKYNLVVEVLERVHFKITGELSNCDQKRELIIASSLCSMIYYIPEKEFLRNSEKEIQRFKDFLLLLDQELN